MTWTDQLLVFLTVAIAALAVMQGLTIVWMLRTMSKRLFELEDGDEEEGQWWQGLVECAICGERHRAVIQIGEDEYEPSVRMECHKCGSMACDPVEEDE